MRNRFDRELTRMHEDLISMAALVETAISRAVEALKKYDADLARITMAGDKEVDQKEREIESACLKLLLQQQPVARDLRNITAAMKMVTDMERIGDHAADISEMSLYIGEGRDLPKFEHINQMASETVMMLNWSIEAYVSKDRQKANEVISHDDVVDRLFDEVKQDIIKLIQEKPQEGEEATDLLMVAKYFERIGDHATNIAEWVIYSLRTSADEN